MDGVVIPRPKRPATQTVGRTTARAASTTALALAVTFGWPVFVILAPLAVIWLIAG